MNKLPFLISVPHGGTLIPPEVKESACITPEDLFDDSDACTRDIYNLAGEVEYHVAAEVARAFVDLNRSTGMRPPEYPDGVVKSKTCYDKPIYREGPPGEQLTDTLLNAYYHPYHKTLREYASLSEVLMGFDCHSMAAVAPAVAPDRGKRPLVNLGDAEGQACDPAWTRWLQKAFMESFDLPEKEVAVNRPFKGGHITRTHGRQPKPWIQVELNRALYLAEPWFDPARLRVDQKRLDTLRGWVLRALTDFHRQGVKQGFF